MKKIIFQLIGIGFVLAFLGGCSTTQGKILQEFPFPQAEADWIINGEPVEFEGELWYPQDNVDILTDSEVLLVGEYRKVQLFVERIDVRPYERLYTKFGRNKFRIFTKKRDHDKSQKSF